MPKIKTRDYANLPPFYAYRWRIATQTLADFKARKSKSWQKIPEFKIQSSVLKRKFEQILPKIPHFCDFVKFTHAGRADFHERKNSSCHFRKQKRARQRTPR